MSSYHQVWTEPCSFLGFAFWLPNHQQHKSWTTQDYWDTWDTLIPWQLRHKYIFLVLSNLSKKRVVYVKFLKIQSKCNQGNQTWNYAFATNYHKTMISLRKIITRNLWDIEWFYCIYSLYAEIFLIKNSSAN